MSLDVLLETAYRRGTGVSRQYALSRSRVRDLTQTFSSHSLPGEVAEFAYLGERLADTAFRQMPKDLRSKAFGWQSLTSPKQLHILQQLMDTLTSAEWRRPRKLKRGYSRYGNPDSVLPLQYKSWAHGPLQPNCLGLAQMLVGFARAAGAPHLLLNVITGADEARHLSLHVIIQEMIAALSVREDDQHRSWLKGKLERWDLKVLTVLSRLYKAHQAHHALLIRLKNGQWQVVDPYMMSEGALFRGDMKIDRGFSRQIYTIMDTIPDKAALVGEVFAADADNNVAEWYSRRLIKQLQLLVLDGGESVESIQKVLTRLRPLMILDSFQQELRNCELKVWLGSSALYATKDMTPGQIRYRVQKAKRHLRVHTRDRQRAYNRAVRGITEMISDIAYGLALPYIAPAMEAVHPAVQLGVATVHHLAAHGARPEPELLKFTYSQFIIRDIADGVELSDREDLQALLNEKFSYWQKLSGGKDSLVTIPGLKPYLQDKET